MGFPSLEAPRSADARVRRYRVVPAIAKHGDPGYVGCLCVTISDMTRTEAVGLLNEAKLDLQARWHGDAADQFATYTSAAITVLSQTRPPSRR